ncbi:hypothetical protein JQ625_13160 [Bradyrhizobium diazoefficiens]|nr:hypothetical protein [Bradyrhizobium diazoefficiens]MBR0775782.1 hypothetical protein [Bradyrhizobium diazoefficiens]
MRRIVLSLVTMALIAASASPAAGTSQHHARKARQATSEPFHNTVAQPSQPASPNSGWSAPAGR